MRIHIWTPKTDAAGMVGVWMRWGYHEWDLHLFIRKGHRHWGYRESWWNGPIHMWGLGPFALFAYHDHPV